MSNNNLKIKNVDTISNTTSSLMPLKGGYLYATSSFMQQKGGYLNNNKNKDINQYQCDSATSESNYTTNSTNTEEIKNKLLNILQDGGGKHYNDLIETFNIYNTSIISLELTDFKSIEFIQNMKDKNGNIYIDKIITILNSKLEINEVKEFLNLLKSEVISDIYNLTKNPILIFSYDRIMLDSSSTYNLEEITHDIRILLYNKIKEIFGNYLTKPLDEIDRLKKKMDKFNSFYYMLQFISQTIESNLIGYLRIRLPPGQSRSLPPGPGPGPEHSRSTRAPEAPLQPGPEYSTPAPSRSASSARPSSSQKTYSAPSQPRSTASTSSSARAPYSARTSSSQKTYSAPSQPHSAASTSSSARAPYSALPSSSRSEASISAAVEKYNKQVNKLTEMMKNEIITSEEYFDTNLALSSHAYYNLIPINMKKSILDAITSSQPINGVVHYFDTDKLLFSIHPKHKQNYEQVGPIYQRRYL